MTERVMGEEVEKLVERVMNRLSFQGGQCISSAPADQLVVKAEAATTLQRVERERDEEKRVSAVWKVAQKAWQERAMEETSRAQAAETQVEAMRMALEPFAAFAEGLDHFGGPSAPGHYEYQSSVVGVRAMRPDDFRKALAALSAPVEERKGDGRQTNVEKHCADPQEVQPLPCPFCKAPGDARVHEEVPTMHIAGCSDPDCIAWSVAYDFVSRDTALAAWNTRAALASSTPESAVYPGWRPIETAPKDGTLVDLWALAPDGKHGHRIADARWDTNRSFNGGIGRVAQPDAWVDRYGGQIWLDGSTVTHWMPRPTAPAEARGDQPEGEA